jgi:hypothetical protein
VPALGTALALLVLLIAFAIAGWRWWRSRLTPEEKERQRRLLIHQDGRIIEALVTGVEGDTVYYQYSLRGVEYNTAQDCSSFTGQLPAQRDSLVGVASCKYHRKNPANSIVICEEWSGLTKFERTTHPQ